MSKNNIKYYIAHGCNAEAVAEYVVAVVAALQANKYLQAKKIRAAVVGVGKIGEQVAKHFKLLGFDVTLCDLKAASLPKPKAQAHPQSLADTATAPCSCQD